jgi:hypothetical protein
MALVLPSSRVEEDVMAGVTCAPPLPSIVATISEEAITGITSSSTVETCKNTVLTSSKTDPTLDSGGVS